MDSKSEINLERPTHAWVSNGKSLSTRSLKLGQLLFSVKNQFTAILERVELCASRSHPIRRLTHCGYRARTVAAVKIPEYQFEGYLVVVVDRGQGMVMAFGFLCCHLAPSYCSSFVFSLLLLRASSVKHPSHESFGRRGSGMFIGTLPGMFIGSLPGMVIGSLPGMVIGGAAPACTLTSLTPEGAVVRKTCNRKETVVESAGTSLNLLSSKLLCCFLLLVFPRCCTLLPPPLRPPSFFSCGAYILHKR